MKFSSSSLTEWRRPSCEGLLTSVPRLKAAAALACDVVDVISAVCTALIDAAVNPVLRRSFSEPVGPEAEAAFLVTPNFGRHAGIGCAEAALPIASPLEVACADAALCGLSGLTDGRQGGRVGLLERSTDRCAEAAAPEPFVKRAVMLVIAAAFSAAVSGGRWADAASPELLTALLAVVPGSRCADAAAPELTTLLFTGAPFTLHFASSTSDGGDIFGGTGFGGDIFGGCTAGHSTGFGHATAGTSATDPLGFGPFAFGTGGAAGAAAVSGAGSPSLSPPSSMDRWPRETGSGSS